MTAPSGPPPHLVAQVDQDQAALSNLVRIVRRHHRLDQCAWPEQCTGRRVRNALYDASPERLEALLTAAILRLTNTNQKGPSTSGS